MELDQQDLLESNIIVRAMRQQSIISVNFLMPTM